eukprot:CAMPEP_0178740232 /NCGR_PEP_ID=MMETSP0744-20121128/4475_1 /TAXON_ID=913974 /ORGANISM="Nitzschia punctata, Strain CCMP561" /LENGTH=123 /DNA_ID=CAMNT_0020392981 /DNA_START=28 /DNA_END=399 /DNA_ORIENTATION=-
MGPKRKATDMTSRKSSSTTSASKKSPKNSAASKTAGSSTSTSSDALPPAAGYLISCDVPTKQYIQYLNELKSVDKKFILEDLDATHLLVKESCRTEVEQKVENWMDENVFSAIERVGENLDMS